jgi:hypothetical protein
MLRLSINKETYQSDDCFGMIKESMNTMVQSHEL